MDHNVDNNNKNVNTMIQDVLPDFADWDIYVVFISSEMPQADIRL